MLKRKKQVNFVEKVREYILKNNVQFDNNVIPLQELVETVFESKKNLSIVLTDSGYEFKEMIASRISDYISSEGYKGSLQVMKAEKKLEANPMMKKQKIPGVKKVIVVSSGKGGVGKSTTAVNIALALSKKNFKVGLFDADIYGPSFKTLLGIDAQVGFEEGKFIPHERYGLQVMSISFIVPNHEKALLWRGPMAIKAFQQSLWGSAWDVDFLIIDLPPGTGDIHLTMVQKLLIDGAVIVTTPQNIALDDVRKGVQLFQKSNDKILGVIENMSYFQCPHCLEKTYIFGSEGGVKEAHNQKLALLGQLPLSEKLCKAVDEGLNIFETDGLKSAAKRYEDIVDKFLDQLH